ncbi:TauD/TfdA family dioxygenase [Burkholderiaceae bacterium FT117]|uniref:TauD/TfdA family dioxygenase n=1 Tax=Zeimonas sediminis TaxID=2944268 RepID=UPI002342D4ED|nr:TauD/TfdA family dioxygenase [Zeimonas sediminis]MCM5571763.1 TauD/TfdA family dioxygenase [Zeimonas sediminis]
MSAQPAVGVASTDLPIFENAQAWYGPEMAARIDWVHRLTEAEIAEIEAVVRAADATGKDILELRRADFPLPGLQPLLDEVRKQVLHGRGFHLLRGIPVERFTIRQSAIAYWGLGLHLGEPVSQNGKGHVLGHVTNLGLNYADPEVRGYQTSARLNYHTDSSDIVALLCLRTAKAGGLSSIVSSTTIWNELVRRRPDHARTLLGEFHRTRWGEIPENKKGYGSNPIFAPYKGRMFASYVRSAIMKAQAMPEVPRLSAEQIEALDHVDALAADPTLHLDMSFEPGDIQLLSNHFVFHSRTAYEDWPEVEKRRHLLRLWLACDDGPELPPSMVSRLGVTARGRPNGICVPGVPFVAPLVAA